MLVPYYLMYSYLNYKKNESIVNDAEYDIICKRFTANAERVGKGVKKDRVVGI